MPEADDVDLLGDPARNAVQQDELENAEVLPLVHAPQSPISGARCVNGNLVRPGNAEEEPPSTACRQSAVNAPGGVALGRGPPGFGKSPGIIPGNPRHQEEVNHQMVQAVAQVQAQVITPIQAAIHTQEKEEQQGPMGQEEESRQEDHPHQEEAIQAAIQAAAHLQDKPPSSQEEQVIQAARHQPLQVYLIKEDIQIHWLHWIVQDRSRKALPSSLYPPIPRIAAYWRCSRS